jgi:protein TonB
MRRMLEASVFLALALAAHVGMFVTSHLSGASSAGDGGIDSFTIEAAPEQLAALVAEWDRPPNVAFETPEMALVAAPFERAPVLTTQADAPATRATAPTLQAPRPDMPALPDNMSAPPPPMPAAPDFAVLSAPSLPSLPTTERSPEIAQHAPMQTVLQPTARLRRPSAQASPLALVTDVPLSEAVPSTQAPDTSPRPPSRPAPSPVQAQQPQQSLAAQPRQQAAGQGAQAAQGQNGTAEASTGPTRDTENLLASWGGSIRAAVQRRQSRVRGGGTVLLQLTVNSGGQLISVSVSQSSGSDAVDNAALLAVRSARFSSAPTGLPGGEHRFNLPVVFAR